MPKSLPSLLCISFFALMFYFLSFYVKCKQNVIMKTNLNLLGTREGQGVFHSLQY